MSTVFLSFLGTSRYLPCNYTYPGREPVLQVDYVQEALLEMFCSDFTKVDKVRIFLTPEARIRNWENRKLLQNELGDSTIWSRIVGRMFYKMGCTDQGFIHIGLKERMSKWEAQSDIREVPIPEGFTEPEIWAIFQSVYEEVPEGSFVILDITHAFRSIPMLAITLLNYLYVVKNVKVKGVYYGAFEFLGSVSLVRDIPVKNRNVPVIDLLSFYELHRWTNAAHAFVSYGASAEIENLISANLEPGLPDKLRKLAGSLHAITSSFATVRGRNIIEGKEMNQLASVADELAVQRTLSPLKPLLQIILAKIAKYKQNSIENGIHSIQWCIDHGLIQQGVTLLDEFIITFVCYQFRDQYKLDFYSKESRAIVNIAFEIHNQPGNKNLNENNKACLLAKELLIRRLRPVRGSIHELRNSINHAGFTLNTPAAHFKEKLITGFAAVKLIFYEGNGDTYK